MDKILHVFSDSKALEIFKKSSIKEDTLFFEEKLLEGNISKPLFSDDFWLDRYDFFEKNYQLSKLDYYDKTIKIIAQLEDVSEYDNVILWGDYSLESHVNLLALCTHLEQHYQKNVSYFLVCSGKHKGRENLQKLTDYNSEEFSVLYKYKAKITLPNLEFSQKAWSVFASKDKSQIQQFDWNVFPSKFQYLHLVMNQFINESF